MWKCNWGWTCPTDEYWWICQDQEGICNDHYVYYSIYHVLYLDIYHEKFYFIIYQTICHAIYHALCHAIDSKMIRTSHTGPLLQVGELEWLLKCKLRPWNTYLNATLLELFMAYPREDLHQFWIISNEWHLQWVACCSVGHCGLDWGTVLHQWIKLDFLYDDGSSHWRLCSSP